MDLAAYLQRIGYEGPRTATHGVLADIVLRHIFRIPFESIDAYVGQRISLDSAEVERKLVASARGGWCFEQNLLLGDALRTMGFDVTDLAARVLWNRPVGTAAARTHRLLCVRINGRRWLVDAGFGGQTPTGVLDLDSQAQQSTPHEPFRLRRMGDERVMETLIRGEWLPLCRFDMQPQLPIDFEAPNFQLVHDPASHFAQLLVVSRATPQGRNVLRGNELAFHAIGSETQRRTIGGSAELLEVLSAVFGIEARNLPQLAAKFDAQVTGSPARS
jgi:N-hydroxyarylamine O-acetyltransferase